MDGGLTRGGKNPIMSTISVDISHAGHSRCLYAHRYHTVSTPGHLTTGGRGLSIRSMGTGLEDAGENIILRIIATEKVSEYPFYISFVLLRNNTLGYH
jgi:hypothetical protein